MKRHALIYGWSEQNEASFGVQKIEFDLVPSEDLVSVASDGKLVGDVIPDGCWYLKYSQAKNACRQYWLDQIKIARAAIRSLSKIKVVRQFINSCETCGAICDEPTIVCDGCESGEEI